jgi:NADH:ubiquinone oxidoreductase subunit E
MNNAYIRPGGVAQDLPHGAVDMVREVVRELRQGLHEIELLLNENPLLKGRTVGVGYLDLTGCVALGVTGPVLRSTGLPHDLRKSDPYCGYETYDFDVVTRTGCDAYDRIRIRIDEMYQSLRIVEQAPTAAAHRGPARSWSQDKKIAWPSQLAIGGDGMGNSLDHIREIMGTSMESLIHHFKLVTEGFRVPPVRPTSRWSRPRASSAATSSPTAAPGPTGRTSATRASTTCRPRPRCARAARSPTSSSPSPPSTPSWEVSTDDGSNSASRPHPATCTSVRRARRRTPPTSRRSSAQDAAEVIARYPQKRSALLPLLHLVQSVDGYVTGRGIDLCAELLDLTTAEVSGVATFYTQYKRHPNGEYTVGVCTNTLCAIMGGDEIWDAVSEHLGVGHDETTRTARSPSSASSATRPATTPRSS